MTRKTKLAAALARLKAYAIIARAVEEGVVIGWHAAHKHTDKPTDEHARECIEREVMNALDEVVDWGDR